MPPAKTKPQPPATSGRVAFGSSDMYVAGGGLPDGDYCLFFDVRMHTPTKQDGTPNGPPRLGVMLTAYSLAEPDQPPRTKFLSMGSKADKSFAPDPTSANDEGLCKAIVLIPNAAGGMLPDSTNWNIFRKSMIDCGLPEGVFTDDLSVLDGVHVHIQNIPEPEERKSFGQTAQTGEVQQEVRNQTVPVVTEIKDDGKPWEGTGGLPTAVPVKTAASAAAKPVAGPKGVVKPAAAATKAGVDTGDVETNAINGIADVLTNNPDGLAKLQLRIQTFKTLTAKHGDEAAQAVIDTFFNGDDEKLGALLGGIGYKLAGAKVVPQ